MLSSLLPEPANLVLKAVLTTESQEFDRFDQLSKPLRGDQNVHLKRSPELRLIFSALVHRDLANEAVKLVAKEEIHAARCR